MRAPAPLSVLSLMLLAACESAMEPAGADATFTAHAVVEGSAGVTPGSWSLSGTVQVFPNHSVYRQESNGRVFESGVTGLLMAPEGPDGRQIFLGLLTDRIQAGTYQVRNGWEAGDRQLYGTVLGPVEDDDTRVHHNLTAGTLTVETTHPVLRATFSFDSETFTRMPRSPVVGETYHGQEGWLHVEGEIGR